MVFGVIEAIARDFDHMRLLDVFYKPLPVLSTVAYSNFVS